MKKNIIILNFLLEKGMTLIEILIVIGIISVLSVVLITAINPVESGRKSRDAKRISDLSTIKRAIDMALADKQKLAITSSIEITSTNIGGLDISKYLPAIPKDPSRNSGNNVRVLILNSGNCESGSSNGPMLYEFVSDGDFYTIRTRFESLSNCDLLKNDGNQNNYYELGTKLNLFP